MNWTQDKPKSAVIDAAHLSRQREFSLATFGPGARTEGVLDHIAKELDEIRSTPTDISEWVDVIILAFDSAWRAGWEPQQILDAIVAKQHRNEARTWPDWRTADPSKAIEHVRRDDDATGLAEPPKCGMCPRERTPQDALDYSPIQVVTRQPLGWYSGDDGEICPECMAQLLGRTN